MRQLAIEKRLSNLELRVSELGRMVSQSPREGLATTDRRIYA